MLKSIIGLLRCPACQTQQANLSLHIFSDGTRDHVADGILTCGCSAWYPIDDGILELVRPELIYRDDLIAFAGNFASQLSHLGLSIPDASGADVEAQRLQRKHFDWYAGNQAQTYTAYQQSPFWKAFDGATFDSWRERIKPGGILLDVGCADGRSCLPLLNSGNTILGFDISKALVKQATERAASQGGMHCSTFFVGDASALPFRDSAFEYVTIYGVLHHVPAPRETCREVYRVLKPSGIYFGSENNVTVLRGAFDALMKLVPIWKEEAGEQALISARHVQEWFAGLPIRFEGYSSVYLPPHLFNLMGNSIAPGALSWSDRLFKLVPGMADQGGLIVFEAVKASLKAEPS